MPRAMLNKSLSAPASLGWAACGVANPRHSASYGCGLRLAVPPIPGRGHPRGLIQHRLSPPRQNTRGFTLVELLVALSVMAILAVLSWQGLDTMVRTQQQTQQRADDVLSLQAGLSQWKADLDAVVDLAGTTPIEWDGRSLRMLRLSTNPADNGPLVVAWARRNIDGQDQWIRWQSPPMQTRAERAQAWEQATLWAQNPGEEQKRREVVVTPMADWRIFFFRDNTWTNPLSSTGNTNTGGNTNAAAQLDAAIPRGVRLELSLPAGMPISGNLTIDWVRPTVGGGKS